jgi:hypothetical protein
MRGAAWLTSIVSVLLGTELAHALAYRAEHADAHERAEALAETGHGYLERAPFAAALVLGIVVVALLLRLGAARRGDRGGPLPSLPFALLGPLVFALQEHVERLVHDGAFPWAAVLEPTFVIGLWLQIPFALLAWFVARSLLAAVDALGRALAEPPARVVATAATRVAETLLDLPRVPVLATGRPVRGPPSFR